MGRARGIFGGAGTVLLAMGLAGCSLLPQPIVTRLPEAPVSVSPEPTGTAATGGTPSPAATASTPEGVADCGGAAYTVTSGSSATVIVGDCPELRVEGSDLAVDASGASVGSLDTSGDRISVRAADLGQLTIQGNGVAVTAATVGALTASGDGNEVTVSGDVGSATVRGNGNTVSAARVGAVVLEGSNNSIG